VIKKKPSQAIEEKEDLLNKGEIIIYTAADGTEQTEVMLQGETLWLTEKQIAALFDRDRTVIGRHIKSVFKTGELEEKSNVQKMHIANSSLLFPYLTRHCSQHTSRASVKACVIREVFLYRGLYAI
jgi:preprotein translocase subunit SecB